MSSVVARLVQLTDDGDVARTFDVADKELVIGRYDGPETRRPKRSRRGTRLLPVDRAMTDPPVPFPPGPRRRQNGCDVHLKFAAISRKHATLAVQEGGSVRHAARIFSFPPGRVSRGATKYATTGPCRTPTGAYTHRASPPRLPEHAGGSEEHE